MTARHYCPPKRNGNYGKYYSGLFRTRTPHGGPRPRSCRFCGAREDVRQNSGDDPSPRSRRTDPTTRVTPQRHSRDGQPATAVVPGDVAPHTRMQCEAIRAYGPARQRGTAKPIRGRPRKGETDQNRQTARWSE